MKTVFTKSLFILFAFALILSLAPSTKAVTLTPTPSPTATPVAPKASFQVVITIDKTSVKAGETFMYTITATNNGTKDISNFELRVPFYLKMQDASILNVNPTFNKLLANNEYPEGFNGRSWLVNDFTVGDKRTYSITYKVADEPKATDAIWSVFTLPLTWSDPDGLQSNVEHKLNYIRVDAYINGNYRSSFENTLPTLAANDAPFSKIKLNDKYYFPGSKSTLLKAINASNINAFPGFTLETSDVRLEWTSTVNFSGTDVADKLSKLDSILTVDWGKITFKDSELKALAAPVKITYKNVEFVTESKVKIKDTIFELKDAKATWNKELKQVTFTQDIFSSSSLYPNLFIENSTIETSESRFVIRGTISDPTAKVKYKLGDEAEKDVLSIDIVNGAFEINIDNKSNAKRVEVTATLKNGEEAEKIILIKTPDAVAAPTEAPASTRTSLPINPITLTLIIAGLAVLSILGGVVYYLYQKNRRTKNLSSTNLFHEIKKIKSEEEKNKTTNPLESSLRRENLSKDDYLSPSVEDPKKPDIKAEEDTTQFLKND